MRRCGNLCAAASCALRAKSSAQRTVGSTKKVGLLKEVTYLWRDNRSSVTRGRSEREYFCDTHMNYIRGQVQGLTDLFKKND